MKETIEDVQYERDNAVQEARTARREAEHASQRAEASEASFANERRESAALRSALGRALNLSSKFETDLIAALLEPVRFMEEHRIRVDDLARYKRVWDALGAIANREHFHTISVFVDDAAFIDGLFAHVVNKQSAAREKLLRTDVDNALNRAKLSLERAERLELENEDLKNKLAEALPQSAPGTRRKIR